MQKLLINGREAVKGMEVTTVRGEKYILQGWREPGAICGGMTGKVYCQTIADYNAGTLYCFEWYPTVIGGEFVEC